MEAATASYYDGHDFDPVLAHELSIEMQEVPSTARSEDAHLTAVLVAVNQTWLHAFALATRAPCRSDVLVTRRSLWLNDYFQKLRALHAPTSAHAALVMHKLDECLARGRGARVHDGSELSTALVEPLALILYCTTQDRLDPDRLVPFLRETALYLESPLLVARANQAALATPLYRLLVARQATEARVLLVRLLLTLAQADAAAVVRGCTVGAQGQAMLPNIFVQTLPKRHPDCAELQTSAARLVHIFDLRKSSFFLDIPPRSPTRQAKLKSPVLLAALPTPAFAIPDDIVQRQHSPYKENVRPRTTAAPRRRPLPSPAASPPIEVRRPSTPQKLAPLEAIEARLEAFELSPVAKVTRSHRPIPMPLLEVPAATSLPPVTPTSRHRKHELQSVASFEWWWRTLPVGHVKLTDHAKLKAVCAAAVALHRIGDLDRAAELYAFALRLPHPSSAQCDGDTPLRAALQINLGACEYERHQFASSIAALQAAVLACPEHVAAHYKLGLAFADSGRRDEAITELQAIAALHAPAKARLQVLLNPPAEARPAPADAMLRAAIGHMAARARALDVLWAALFRCVDRSRCGVVGMATFRDMLHLAGVTLSAAEWRALLVFAADPRDANYVTYQRLEMDSALQHTGGPQSPIDKACFNGVRRRTGMERLRVSLHLLAQREATSFCGTVAQWARFGVDKTIDVNSSAPPVSSTWMPFVVHVPPCPTSMLSSLAAVLVAQSTAKGVASAHRAIRLRRLVTRKVVEVFVAKGVVYAVANVTKILHDARTRVATHTSTHSLMAGRAVHSLRRHTVDHARTHVTAQALARNALLSIGARAKERVAARYAASAVDLPERGAQARAAVARRRRVVVLFAKVARTSASHCVQRAHATASLGDIAVLACAQTARREKKMAKLLAVVSQARSVVRRRHTAEAVFTNRAVLAKTAYYTVFHAFQAAISAITGLPLPAYDLPWMFRKYEILPNDEIELPVVTTDALAAESWLPERTEL
ncbi:hypothetical protein ACHHYP_00839 [Achlya hypogyna]|uniref:Uncharacterized protein n=1 Tax=Achlya hypogyna TaxID=1202772 RepID=A0A1V9ZAD7_ACHHY|nr:hypothetical protein ACHHYP_00839 [Achlya hypogyna]